ncbi:MAG: stage III sporulation protein AD [Clostridium sp.]|nr:stage III sporulation protein AD [Clostridium sp.]
MGIETAAAVGIIAVLTAVQFKSRGAEFGIYIILAAGILIFFYSAGKLRIILEAIRQIQSCIQLNQAYLTALLKMAGITYIAELASGLCRDAGYSSMGTQIEMFGKLSILAVSTPIVLALFKTLETFLK